MIGRLKCAAEDFFTWGLEVCLVNESYQAEQKKSQKEEEERVQQEESSLKKEETKSGNMSVSLNHSLTITHSSL